MPTASTRRASSTSGRRPRSTPCSGPRAALFKRFYDVTPGGNWEGHTILNRSCRAGARRRGNRGRACGMPRTAAAGASEPGAARLGRQGAGRLERADDRRAGRGRHRVRAARLDRAGARRVRLHPTRDDRCGRTAAAQLARRAGAASGQRRRLRQSVPRRAGAARGDRRQRRSSPRPRTGWRSSTGITGTRRAAAISFRPTTRRR